jgi:hypothetical protein
MPIPFHHPQSQSATLREKGKGNKEAKGASSSIAKTVSEDDGGGVFGGGVDGEKGKRGHACGYAGWGKVRMMKGLVEDGVVGCEDENKGWDENEETVLGEHYDGQEGCRV